jgi:ATP-dependent Clp protease ATP-binding subunit ClpB
MYDHMTLSEYQKYIEKDAAGTKTPTSIRPRTFSRRQPFLFWLKGHENHHGVRIQDSFSFRCNVAKIAKHHKQILPIKPLIFIDEACVSIRVQLDSQPENYWYFERYFNFRLKQLHFKKGKGQFRKIVKVNEEISHLKESLVHQRRDIKWKRQNWWNSSIEEEIGWSLRTKKLQTQTWSWSSIKPTWNSYAIQKWKENWLN